MSGERRIALRVKGWFARLGRVPRPAAEARLRRWPTIQLATAAAVTIVLLVAVWTMADAAAIIAARQLPHGVIRFFDVITDYGKSGWFLWPLGIYLAVAGLCAGALSNRAGLLVASVATRAMFLFAAIALPGLFVNLVKGLIGRARPFVGGSADPFLFNPWTWKPAYASLPSGHGAAAASVAVAFGMLWPRLRPFLWLYVLAICVSRIVVTAHHPTDVLAGALVGAGGAWLVCRYMAVRSLGFAIDGTGRIYATPGPSWRRIKRVAAFAFAK
jgi:membrane-associated phospholipid phosphatase